MLNTFLVLLWGTAGDFSSQIYQTRLNNLQPGYDSYPKPYRELSWPVISY